jgi:peptidoglycan/LPS O-acetylase OafA/YrhL
MPFLRPYLGTALVGGTLLAERRWQWVLTSRPMRYIAEISYALYVIHPVTRFGWLSSGGTLVKYLKRPLALAVTFGLAHLSTFHFEHHWMALGKRLSRRWDQHRPGRVGPSRTTVPARGPTTREAHVSEESRASCQTG